MEGNLKDRWDHFVGGTFCIDKDHDETFERMKRIGFFGDTEKIADLTKQLEEAKKENKELQVYKAYSLYNQGSYMTLKQEGREDLHPLGLDEWKKQIEETTPNNDKEEK